MKLTEDFIKICLYYLLDHGYNKAIGILGGSYQYISMLSHCKHHLLYLCQQPILCSVSYYFQTGLACCCCQLFTAYRMEKQAVIHEKLFIANVTTKMILKMLWTTAHSTIWKLCSTQEELFLRHRFFFKTLEFSQIIIPRYKAVSLHVNQHNTILISQMNGGTGNDQALES